MVRIWRGGQDQGGHQCRWSWRDIGHHPFHYPLEAFRGQVDKVPIRYPDTQSVLLGSFLANLLLRLQCVSLSKLLNGPHSPKCFHVFFCTFAPEMPFVYATRNYWVGQKVCLGFSVRWYGKTGMKCLAHPIYYLFL